MSVIALVLPVVLWNGCPCIEEGAGRYLLDTGAAISLVRDVHGPCSESASKLGASNGAALAFPPGLDGILGWDWMKASAKDQIEVDVCRDMALRLDENSILPSAVQRGKFERRLIGSAAQGSAPGELPCIDVALYGVSSSTGIGVIDTGSPVTILSPQVAEAAALFDEQQLRDDVQTLMTTGTDGRQTQLSTRRAAGIVLGGSGGIERASCQVYSGEVPLMASTGVDALIGLDLLGQNFALDLRADELQVWVAGE